MYAILRYYRMENIDGEYDEFPVNLKGMALK